VIARRATEHGSGLRRLRWVVERTFAWLHFFRRLRLRWERRPELHEAFLRLGCAVICQRHLRALKQVPKASVFTVVVPTLVPDEHQPSRTTMSALPHSSTEASASRS
jgi:hypothetical protein